MQSLSTRNVPAGMQLPFLHDFISKRIAALRFAPRDNSAFDFAIDSQFIGQDTVLGTTAYSAMTGMRERGHLADGRSNYVLSIHDTDYELEIGGRTQTVQAHDLVIVNEANAFRFSLPGTRATILGLDRERMKRVAPAIDARSFHVLPARTPNAALLSGYLALLKGQPIEGDVSPIADHIYHLVARALAPVDGEEVGGLKAVASARLHLIKRHVDEHASNPALGIENVSARHGLSARYVQQLFASRNTTFSDYLRERRLDLAMARLRDVTSEHLSVAEIAFEAGFGDLSTFNRAFKRRFERTPREVRATIVGSSH